MYQSSREHFQLLEQVGRIKVLIHGSVMIAIMRLAHFDGRCLSDHDTFALVSLAVSCPVSIFPPVLTLHASRFTLHASRFVGQLPRVCFRISYLKNYARSLILAAWGGLNPRADLLTSQAPTDEHDDRSCKSFERKDGMEIT